MGATTTPSSVSLRARLGIVALVFLSLVLVAAGLSALSVRSWNRTLETRAEVQMATDDVAELQLSFSDQETAIRGYQLSQDVAALDPYRNSAVVTARLFTRLRSRDVPAPDFQERVDAAEAIGAHWRSVIAEPTIADPDQAPGDELARAMFDDVRTEFERLSETVDGQLVRLVDRTDQVRRLTFGVLFASAMAAIVAAGLITVLFGRWITRPLARLATAAHQLRTDDAMQLPDFDAPELQSVTEAIRELQRSLVSSRDDAVTALAGLEQSAALAVQVRSQLTNDIGPMPDGWSADSLLIPAEGVVAGDCFDVGLLDAGRIYVVMIDVTGHGAGAALDAITAKSQLRSALRSRLQPGSALDWLSRETRRDEHANLLTAFVAIIDVVSGRCDYANAGHPPALLTDGTEIVELGSTGPLVGAFRATWRTDSVEIDPGSMLVMYTDGVTDALGPDRERFGETRLRGCISDLDPTATVGRIHQSIEAFRSADRTDDVTVLAFSRARRGSTLEHRDTVTQ